MTNPIVEYFKKYSKKYYTKSEIRKLYQDIKVKESELK